MSGRDGPPKPLDETLPKSKRVRKRSDFVHIQAKGARVATRHFVLLVMRRDDGAPARLGMVASRKIGGAVQRNRAKRLLREVFRRRADLFPAGADVVVIVRAGAPLLSYDAVERELARIASALRTAANRPLATPGRSGG